MNSVLIEKKDIHNNRITLNMKKSLHLYENVKVNIGDSLKVTILNEGLGQARVVGADNELITLEILEKMPGITLPINLLIGASRPPTMKKVLEHGTSMGVSSFEIFKAELSQKSYLQSKLYQDDDYKELIDLGLEQSAVYFKRPTLRKTYSRKELNFENIKHKFILSPYAQANIGDFKIDKALDSIFAIGPERGWTNEELIFFRNQGFQEIKISPSILRVEIATFALLGQLNQMYNK